MSQIITPPSSNDALILNMVADGSTTSSGNSYVFPVGDDTVFSTVGVRGDSISLDAVDDTKINLKKGLYQINFNAWVQTGPTGTTTVTGSLDYILQVSTSPVFAFADVIYDRLLLYYDGVTPIIDPSHTTLYNVTNDTTIYFRITLANGQLPTPRTWYVRSAESIAGGAPATNIQVMRVGDAL